MSAGSSRSRSSAVRNCVCHGQRAAIRSVTWRAVRVIRPGMFSRRRRSVRAVGMTVSGSPLRVVHRSRLWLRAAITVQAALARNTVVRRKRPCKQGIQSLRE